MSMTMMLGKMQSQRKCRYFVFLVLALLASSITHALVVVPKESLLTSRKAFFKSILATTVALPTFVSAVHAEEEQAAKRISDKELKEIVKSDLLDRQFLATGQLTRAAYKPTATFTDEIDTYGLEQWIKGTQKLFVGEKSSVRLVGDVEVTSEKIVFKFDESLCFRIPFRPTVALSGTVILARDPDSGLISSYREIWDQDVATVLKSAKF
jgi:hypothetical protein